jgi:site-specific DNA-methyltransferase (adenine-specific)
MSRTTKDPATARVMFSSASDDWPTPKTFYEQLHEEFGFVLDVCASSTNRKTAAYYGLDHENPNRRDGLAGDWAADARRHGGAVWMNPPYGRGIGAWMAKAAETASEGVTVVCLVPARTCTKWFHDMLAAGAAVRFVRGRLKFGDAKHAAPFGSVVAIFNPPAGTRTHVPGSHTEPAPAAEPVELDGDVDRDCAVDARGSHEPAMNHVTSAAGQGHAHRKPAQRRQPKGGAPAPRATATTPAPAAAARDTSLPPPPAPPTRDRARRRPPPRALLVSAPGRNMGRISTTGHLERDR